MTAISVMTFNVAVGGDTIDLTRVAQAIVSAGADVVGLQEICGNLPRLASMLGWQHFDEPRQIMSRFPIAATGGDAVFVLIEPEKVLAHANVHLPAYPYGPYRLRDGASEDEVVAEERATRLADLERRVPVWRSLIADGIPLVVTGDFNVPSPVDWGPGAGSHRETAVPWPVAIAMADLGFVDTYRAANPERAGISWTYGLPYPGGDPDELRDRIDFVWASRATVVQSLLVGPSGAPDVDIAVDPWPSDHLGVVSKVEVEAAQPPPFVAPAVPVLTIGDRLAIRFNAPGGETDRIQVVDSTETVLMQLPPMEVRNVGIVYFGTAQLTTGRYEARLATERGSGASSPFWLVEPGARPYLAARWDGDDLVVEWGPSRPQAWGWIGVYHRNDPDLAGGAVGHARTLAEAEGTRRIASMPRSPLTVRMFASGTYEIIAEVSVD